MDFLLPSSKKIKTSSSAREIPRDRFSIPNTTFRSATLSEIPNSEPVPSKCPPNPVYLFTSPEANLQEKSDPHVLGAELTKAILSKKYDTLKLLLQKGANPNYPLQSPEDSLSSENSVDSPLVVAAMLDDIEAASDLLDYGASLTGNVTAENIDFSPIGVAIKRKNYAVLDLFLQTINQLYDVEVEEQEEEVEGENEQEEEEEEVDEDDEKVDPNYSTPTSKPTPPTNSPNGISPPKTRSSPGTISPEATPENRPQKRPRED